jgi:hypothetical protein
LNEVLLVKKFVDDICKIFKTSNKPGKEKLGPVDAKGGWQYGQVLQVIEQVLIVKLQDVQPHVPETPDGVTMAAVINFARRHKRR